MGAHPPHPLPEGPPSGLPRRQGKPCTHTLRRWLLRVSAWVTVRRRGEQTTGISLHSAEFSLDLSELDHECDEGIEEGEVDVRVDDEVGEVKAVGIGDGLEAIGAEGPAQRGVAVYGGDPGVEAVLAGILVAARGAWGALAAGALRGVFVVVHGDKGRGWRG